MKAALALFLCAMAALGLVPSAAQQPPALSVKPVVEKKLKELPQGPLFWRVETFPTLSDARAAEGPTALAAEISGKVWLFTLGSKGGATRGRRQGCRDRSGTAGPGAGVPAAHQSCEWPAGCAHAASFPPRVGGLLCAEGTARAAHAARHRPCRCRRRHERPRRRHAHGGVQRRYRRSRPARDVRRRRHTALLITGTSSSDGFRSGNERR